MVERLLWAMWYAKILLGAYSPYWVAYFRERSLVLHPLHVPCFVDAHGRPAPFLIGIEEEGMGVGC